MGAQVGNMEVRLTVFALFQEVKLPLHGPVPWKTPIPKADAGDKAGIYVVARVGQPTMNCEAAPLPLVDPTPANLVIDLDYERRRWLPNESVVYIGKTDRTIAARVGEFYNHTVGNASKHAGGQMIKLLQCDLWVYWSRANAPINTENEMLAVFRRHVNGKNPYGNDDGQIKKRVSIAVKLEAD